MKLSRFLSAGVVSCILAVSMSVGLAVPAQAASLLPNGWNPRQYMINVLGSMLSSAGGDSPAKRAVIAADQTFDHSWEGFEESYKAKVAAGTPNTYQEYALSAQEKFDAEGLTSTPGDVNHPNSKKYVPKSTIPATKAMKLRKLVGGPGGAFVALTAFQFRSEISTGISTMLGIDAQGQVCSDPVFSGANPLNWITGQDCNAYRNTIAEGQANQDASIGLPGSVWCADLGASHICYRMAAPYIGPNPDWWYLDMSGTATPVTNAAGTVYARSGPAGAWQYLGPVRIGNQCGVGVAADVVCSGEGAGYWGLPSSGPKPTQFCTVYQAGGQCVGEISTPEPSAVADPPRQFVCEITGADGNTYRASSDQFTEGGTNLAPIVCPAMPTTVMPNDVTVKETGPSGPVVVGQETTTPEYRDFYTKYPQCREGACKLDLKQKKANLTSCFDDVTSSESCLGWFVDPLKADNYQCTYGGYDVALTECNVYSQVFKPDKITAGQAYADPLTGLPVSGQSSPNAATESLNRLATNPRDFSGCLDRGWGVANPVEWVMVPVTCSMQASFAPRAGFTDGELTKVALTWANTGPAKLAASVGQWKIAPNVAGCSSSMNFPVPMIGKTITVPIIQACPGTPFGDFAPFVRALVSAGLIITAGFACKRIVAGWIV